MTLEEYISKENRGTNATFCKVTSTSSVQQHHHINVPRIIYSHFLAVTSDKQVLIRTREPLVIEKYGGHQYSGWMQRCLLSEYFPVL